MEDEATRRERKEGRKEDEKGVLCFVAAEATITAEVTQFFVAVTISCSTLIGKKNEKSWKPAEIEEE